MINWKNIWDGKSKKNFLDSMAKSSYNFIQFLIYLKTIEKNLKGLNAKDVLLDCGCGYGYLSLIFSPFVKKIYCFDYSKKMIKRGKKFLKETDNIKIYNDDILTFKNTRKQKVQFNKVLVGSVFQYLKNYDELEYSLRNLFEISRSKTKYLITQIPDKKKQKVFFILIKKLIGIKKKEKSLIYNKNIIWIDYKKFKKMSQDIGFKVCRKINIDKNLFQSKYMYDLYLEK